MLLVFTDGSTINNGKKGAKGGVGVYIVETDITYEIKNEKEYSENIKNPTNQKCELLAIKRALTILDEEFNSYKGSIMLYSDSMYSINCLTKWYKSWKNNGWKNTKGKDVKNKEIIQEILEIIPKNIIFNHIRSHQMKPKDDASDLEKIKWFGNDKADNLAKYTSPPK